MRVTIMPRWTAPPPSHPAPHPVPSPFYHSVFYLASTSFPSAPSDLFSSFQVLVKWENDVLLLWPPRAQPGSSEEERRGTFSFGSGSANCSRGVKLLSHDYCDFIPLDFVISIRWDWKRRDFNEACDVAQRKAVSLCPSETWVQK